MPWVVRKKNNKLVNMPWLLTETEVDNLERNSPVGTSYELLNPITMRKKTVKGRKR